VLADVVITERSNQPTGEDAHGDDQRGEHARGCGTEGTRATFEHRVTTIIARPLTRRSLLLGARATNITCVLEEQVECAELGAEFVRVLIGELLDAVDVLRFRFRPTPSVEETAEARPCTQVVVTDPQSGLDSLVADATHLHWGQRWGNGDTDSFGCA
jgi:hypothetical protein